MLIGLNTTHTENSAQFKTFKLLFKSTWHMHFKSEENGKSCLVSCVSIVIYF